MTAIFNTIFNFRGTKGNDCFTLDTIIFIDPLTYKKTRRLLSYVL